jgi:uncharacterized protein (TIGR03437 family)
VRRCEFNDFNGDGKLDAALVVRFEISSSASRNYVALMIGDGMGRFSPPVTADVDVNTYDIFANDFNNDAKSDVLTLARGNATFFRGDGAGKLSAGVNSSLTTFSSSVAVGDFNQDGRPDIVQGNYENRSYSVHLNRCATGNYISGRITDRIFTTTGLAGVTVKLSGGQTATTQTDSSGYYDFGSLAVGGNYIVTPEPSGFEFVPDKQSFTNLTADQVADFNGTRQAVAVSAASFKTGSIAPDSIAALFGVELATATAPAQSLPLPFLLGNTLVSFHAASGFERRAPLFFASPGQVNLLVPPDLPLGKTAIVVGGIFNTPYSIGMVEIENVAPGLFSADATGQGLAAAVALRVRRDGSQVYEPVTRFDPAQNRIVAVPIDLGDTEDQVFLLFFGTGIRRHATTATPAIKLGGVDAEVLFAGAQGSFAGLDQVNVQLPRSLAGRGEVDVLLTVDGRQANAVKVNFK